MDFPEISLSFSEIKKITNNLFGKGKLYDCESKKFEKLFINQYFKIHKENRSNGDTLIDGLNIFA